MITAGLFTLAHSLGYMGDSSTAYADDTPSLATRPTLTVVNHNQVLRSELSIPFTANDMQLATTELVFQIDGEIMQIQSITGSGLQSVSVSINLASKVTPGNHIMHIYSTGNPLTGVYVPIHITPQHDNDPDTWETCDVLGVPSTDEHPNYDPDHPCDWSLYTQRDNTEDQTPTVAPPISPPATPKPIASAAQFIQTTQTPLQPEPTTSPNPVAAPTVLANTYATPIAAAQFTEAPTQSLNPVTAVASIASGIAVAGSLAWVANKLGLNKLPKK